MSMIYYDLNIINSNVYNTSNLKEINKMCSAQLELWLTIIYSEWFRAILHSKLRLTWLYQISDESTIASESFASYANTSVTFCCNSFQSARDLSVGQCGEKKQQQLDFGNRHGRVWETRLFFTISLLWENATKPTHPKVTFRHSLWLNYTTVIR